MKFGIIQGEGIAQYHATDAASHSKLEVLRDRDRGTLKFYRQFVAKTAGARSDKDCFDVGSGIDALLLEGPEAFAARTWVAPSNFRWNTTEGAALVASKRKQGLIVLSEEEATLVHNLRNACHRNPDLSALLSVGTPQVTLRHNLGPFAVQVRPDWMNREGVTLPTSGEVVGPYLVDLKSAEDMTLFFKMIPGYYRAAALYREIYREVIAAESGIEVELVAPPDWFWAVAFKSEPVCAVVYRPDPERLQAATLEVIDDLKLLARCYSTGKWAASVEGVQQLQPWRKSA